MDPTVYVVIAGDACAFDKGGEIICTTEWNEQNQPIWEAGGMADHRGAGGHEGFEALHNALWYAERNSRLCGFEPVRLPSNLEEVNS